MHCVQNFRNKVTDMILTIVPVPLNSNHSNQSWYCAFWVPQKLVLSSLPTICHTSRQIAENATITPGVFMNFSCSKSKFLTQFLKMIDPGPT